MPWIELTADQGVQEKASGKQGGRFDVVKNLSQLATGDYLTKRLGYTRIANTSPGGVLRMDQYDATRAPMWLDRVRSYDAIGTTGGQVFVANPDDVNHVFNYAGSFGTCKPQRTLGSINSSWATSGFGYEWYVGAYAPSVAKSDSGWTCVAAITSDDFVIVQLIDPNGVVTSRARFPHTGSVVRVLKTTRFYVIVDDNNSLYVYWVSLSLGGATWNKSAALVSWTGAHSYWDATTNGTDWWVVYQHASTTLRVAKFSYLNPGATYDITVSAESTYGASAATITWIADCPTDTLWVGWRDGDSTDGRDIYYTVLNEDCTDATGGSGPYQIVTTATSARRYEPPIFGRAEYMGFEDYSPATTPAALALMYYRDTSATPDDYYTDAFLATATSGATTNPDDWRKLYHIRPIAKPDNNNRFWCVYTAGGDREGELFRPVLVRLAVRWYDLTDTVIDVAMSVELTGPQSQYGVLNLDTDYGWIGTVGANDSSAVVAIPVVRQGTDLANEIQIHLLEYTLPEQDRRCHSAKLWEQLLVAGAPTVVGANPFSMETDATGAEVPPMLMGSSEVAFVQQPVPVYTSEASVGGSVAPGTYKHVAVFQFVDAMGRRHRSAPSPIVETTVTTGDAIRVYVTPPTCTVRGESSTHLRPVTLFYRTEDGQDVFKYVGQSNCLATSSIVLMTDESADATIADEEVVYTDGGVLAFDTAPSCRWVCVSEERLWFAGLFQRELVQCSNKLIPTEGPSCPDDNAFRIILPGESEGIASMDGRTVLFTTSGIYLVTGDGPDRQGVGSFGDLQTLSTGIGCINGYSVLSTPVGVIFQSRDGYYLLPRGFGSVVPIGDAIRDTVRTGDGQYCWGASLVNTQTGIEARWLVSSSSSVDPYTLLVLNVRTMQWSIDVIAPLVSPRVDTFGAIGTWTKGCVLAHTDLNDSYPIRYQMYDDAQATDNGGTASTDYVQSELRTSWQHPFGVGQWGRVDKVLVNMDGNDYTATVQVETVGYLTYKDTYSKSFDLATTAPQLGEPYNTVVLDGIRGQQCSAVRVTVSDAKLSAVNSTFGVVSIWMHVTPADREIPLPSARRG